MKSVMTQECKNEYRRQRMQARQRGKRIKIRSHTRLCFQMQGSGKQLARWHNLETAVFRLCSATDRAKMVFSREKEMAQNLISLIQDTYLTKG